MDTYSTDWLLPRYGMFALDYADRWPELTEALRRMYLDKTAGIGWLPKDWRASVNALHGASGKLLMPVQASAVSSTGETPKFLDTAAKRAWWNDFQRQVVAAQQAFVDGERTKGLAQLESMYANSRFWDGAYNIATVLATPVTVVRGVAGFAANYPRAMQAILIGGVALVAWYFFRRKN
jgi:hypothetical protein